MDRESLAAGVTTTTAELREQLSLMVAASQLLERTAGAKEQTYLAALNQGICRMLRTVCRMELAYRLTDENEIRAFPELLDLGPWAESLAGHAKSVLALAGITLEWENPVSLLMNGDAGLLRSMVQEMINAATSAGRQVKFTVAQQGDKVHIRVTGSGEVIARPVAPDCLTSDEEDLGQAMVRQIAQLHGGTLVTCLDGSGCRSLTAILPQRLNLPAGQLKSPRKEWSGGFDPELVAFSHLLPEDAFRPEELR